MPSFDGVDAASGAVSALTTNMSSATIESVGPQGTITGTQTWQSSDGSRYHQDSNGSLYSWDSESNKWIETVVVTAPPPNGGAVANAELPFASADLLNMALAARSLYLQSKGQFYYRGQALPLSMRGGQNIRIAKLTQGLKVAMSDFTSRSLTALSIGTSAVDAAEAGFSYRADAKLALNVGLTAAAVLVPEAAIPILLFEAADEAGAFNSVWKLLPNDKLVSIGPANKP